MTQRFFSLLFMVCMFMCKTWAADSYVLDKELTWDQVKGGTTAFALVSGSSVLYGSGEQNTGLSTVGTAIADANGVSLWKVETTSGGYFFRGYNTAGVAYRVWGEDGYLNAQSSQTGVSFILGKTTKTNGKDIDNGAVWTVTSTTGGYYIKNVGNNGYLNGTNTSATADKVWKFYSIKEYGREDFVFNGYDANDGYTLRPIRQYGKNLVYADDVNTKVTLHGVMDTPNAYFNNNRWQIADWNNRYNNDRDVANCLNYFEKLLSAFVDHKSGSYVDLFRLHLDPAWTNDPNKTATGSGNEDDISRFSADRLRTYMDKLYWPIAKKAIDKGMYVIMRPPGVCPKTIQVGDAYQQYLKTVWDIVSKDENVKKYAGMIMIELANEPVTVLDTDGTNSNNRASVLHDFFQPIVDIIRANGFRGIVLSSGTGYQSQYGGYATKPITGDNIGYAVHWYPGWFNTNNTKASISDQTIINQFHTQVPVVDSRPIVITEVDWSPEDASGEIDHYNEFNQPVYKNYGTWATGYTSSFGKNFKATHDYYGNISMTLTHPYEYVDFDQLFNNGKVTYSFQSKAEPKEACAYTCFMDWYPKLYKDHSIGGTGGGGSTPASDDLTADMFHKWTGIGATATIDNERVYPAYALNESTGTPYGDSNVNSLYYADLSQYGTLKVTVSDGEPRFCFNREANDGNVTIEFPRDKDSKTYETVKDNGDGTTTYTIDLQAIVKEAGYAHLHCIKGANFADVTVTSMKVYPIDNCLKITTPEAKTDVWDWQVRYPLPTTLATGKNYTVEIVAKAANETNVGVWPVVSSDESKLQYGSINVTTEWSTQSFDTNGAYAYDYLFFNIGKIGGDFMISNIKITDKSTGTVIINNNMNDNTTWTRTQNDLIAETVSSETKAEIKEGVKDFELVDGVEYTNMQEKQYNKLTYTRKFLKIWNPICVPFSINVEDYKDLFDVAEIFAFCPYEDTNKDGEVTAEDQDKLILNKKKTGMTKPGKPYLIRPKVADTYTIYAADGKIYPANASSVQCATTKNTYTITGLYKTVYANAQNGYYYIVSDGTLSHRTDDSSTTIKANRWYMTVNAQDAYGVDSSAAKASYGIVVIGEDLDEATAVRLVKGDSQKNNSIYTLQGVKVTGTKLAPGAYIKNGRKFIIK